jgi:hypothetical protein
MTAGETAATILDCPLTSEDGQFVRHGLIHSGHRESA